MKFSQPEIREIIYKISEERHVPIKDVESILLFYFRKVMECFMQADKENNKFPTIRFPYLGRFMVHINKVNYFNKKYNNLESDDKIITKSKEET